MEKGGCPPSGVNLRRRSSILKFVTVNNGSGSKAPDDGKPRRRVSFANHLQLKNFCKEEAGLFPDSELHPVADFDRVSPLPNSERNEGSPLREHSSNSSFGPFSNHPHRTEEFREKSTQLWNLSPQTSTSFNALDETSMEPSSFVGNVIEFDRRSMHNMTTLSILDMSISGYNPETSSDGSSASGHGVHNTTILPSSFEITNSDGSLDLPSKQSISQAENLEEMDISSVGSPKKNMVEGKISRCQTDSEESFDMSISQCRPEVTSFESVEVEVISRSFAKSVFIGSGPSSQIDDMDISSPLLHASNFEVHATGSSTKLPEEKSSRAVTFSEEFLSTTADIFDSPRTSSDSFLNLVTSSTGGRSHTASLESAYVFQSDVARLSGAVDGIAVQLESFPFPNVDDLPGVNSRAGVQNIVLDKDKSLSSPDSEDIFGPKPTGGNPDLDVVPFWYESSQHNSNLAEELTRDKNLRELNSQSFTVMGTVNNLSHASGDENLFRSGSPKKSLTPGVGQEYLTELTKPATPSSEQHGYQMLSPCGNPDGLSGVVMKRDSNEDAARSQTDEGIQDNLHSPSPIRNASVAFVGTNDSFPQQDSAKNDEAEHLPGNISQSFLSLFTADKEKQIRSTSMPASELRLSSGPVQPEIFNDETLQSPQKSMLPELEPTFLHGSPVLGENTTDSSLETSDVCLSGPEVVSRPSSNAIHVSPATISRNAVYPPDSSNRDKRLRSPYNIASHLQRESPMMASQSFMQLTSMKDARCDKFDRTSSQSFFAVGDFDGSGAVGDLIAFFGGGIASPSRKSKASLTPTSAGAVSSEGSKEEDMEISHFISPKDDLRPKPSSVVVENTEDMEISRADSLVLSDESSKVSSGSSFFTDMAVSQEETSNGGIAAEVSVLQEISDEFPLRTMDSPPPGSRIDSLHFADSNEVALPKDCTEISEQVVSSKSLDMRSFSNAEGNSSGNGSTEQFVMNEQLMQHLQSIQDRPSEIHTRVYFANSRETRSTIEMDLDGSFDFKLKDVEMDGSLMDMDVSLDSVYLRNRNGPEEPPDLAPSADGSFQADTSVNSVHPNIASESFMNLAEKRSDVSTAPLIRAAFGTNSRVSTGQESGKLMSRLPSESPNSSDIFGSPKSSLQIFSQEARPSSIEGTPLNLKNTPKILSGEESRARKRRASAMETTPNSSNRIAVKRDARQDLPDNRQDPSLNVLNMPDTSTVCANAEGMLVPKRISTGFGPNGRGGIEDWKGLAEVSRVSLPFFHETLHDENSRSAIADDADYSVSEASDCITNLSSFVKEHYTDHLESSWDTFVSVSARKGADYSNSSATENLLRHPFEILVQEALIDAAGDASLDAAILAILQGNADEHDTTQNNSGDLEVNTELVFSTDDDHEASKDGKEKALEHNIDKSFVDIDKTFVDFEPSTSSNGDQTAEGPMDTIFTHDFIATLKPPEKIQEEDTEFMKFMYSQIVKASLECHVEGKGIGNYLLTVTGKRSAFVLFICIPLTIPYITSVLKVLHWDVKPLLGDVRVEPIRAALSAVPRTGQYVVNLLTTLKKCLFSQEALLPPPPKPPVPPSWILDFPNQC